MEPNNVDTSLTYLSTVLNFIRDLVKASVWPAVLIYALWSFKDDISKLVTRFRGLSARIAGAYVNLSISETVNALNDILAEVDRAARSFSDKEWDLFNAVVAAPAQTPRIVDDLSSDVLKGPFVRNGEIVT